MFGSILYGKSSNLPSKLSEIRPIYKLKKIRKYNNALEKVYKEQLNRGFEIYQTISCHGAFLLILSLNRETATGKVMLDRAMDNILMVSTKIVKYAKSLVYSIRFTHYFSFEAFIDFINSYLWPKIN